MYNTPQLEVTCLYNVQLTTEVTCSYNVQLTTEMMCLYNIQLTTEVTCLYNVQLTTEVTCLYNVQLTTEVTFLYNVQLTTEKGTVEDLVDKVAFGINYSTSCNGHDSQTKVLYGLHAGESERVEDDGLVIKC